MTEQPGTAAFAVRPSTGDDPPTVVVSGDLDLANAPQFEEAMAGALAGATALTVDLTGVTYCDSAAVRALFASAAATELTMLVRKAGHITTLLGISGLDRVATVITVD
ncbi:MAG: STAS domain-containing protein [Mycobacterium sp.]|nr:STAS domain-containing protein [Mycobacterium sp.]